MGIYRKIGHAMSILENIMTEYYHILNDDLSTKTDRVEKLNKITIHQMQILTKNENIQALENKS